jgi:hypothetical protein
MDLRQVVNRQFINIASDCSVASGNNFNVTIALRFVPDEVIIRQVTYASENDVLANSIVCQLYSNLTEDPIMCTFTNYITSNVEMQHRMSLQSARKSSTYNFQIQAIPLLNTANTGNGNLVTCGAGGQVTGQLGLMLEFIQFKQ